MTLNKEQILARKPEEIIEIKLSDGSVVKGKPFDTGAHSRLLRETQKQNKTDVDLAAFAVMLGVVNDEGEPMFTLEDLPAIMALDVHTVTEISTALLVKEKNPLEHEAELAKNS